jgi:hypothetical protein
MSCLLTNSILAIACVVWEKHQPEVQRGISHGVGPESNWDYVTVWATVVIVLLTLFYSVKWLISPKESESVTIKGREKQPGNMSDMMRHIHFSRSQ